MLLNGMLAGVLLTIISALGPSRARCHKIVIPMVVIDNILLVRVDIDCGKYTVFSIDMLG
jgi:hypothetical protein